MTFTTKYEKGQKLWIMRGENEDARPQEVIIDFIQAQFGDDDEDNGIFYEFYDENSGKTESAEEENIFATKQELLDSL